MDNVLTLPKMHESVSSEYRSWVTLIYYFKQ